jgi:formate dehydrogenase subunit delta
MTNKQLDALILMVNQISANNEHYGSEEAAERVSKHLKGFWARSMKQLIISYMSENGADLSPIARRSIELLSNAYPEMKSAQL